MNKMINFGFALMFVLTTTSINFDIVAQNEKRPQETFASSQMTMNIEGMTCAIGCASVIEKELNNLDGIDKASVDFESKKAVLSFNSQLTSKASILDFINNYKKSKYSASIVGDKKQLKKTCCSSKKQSCSTEQKTKCTNKDTANKDSKSSEMASSTKCTKPCCAKK